MINIILKTVLVLTGIYAGMMIDSTITTALMSYVAGFMVCRYFAEKELEEVGHHD